MASTKEFGGAVPDTTLASGINSAVLTATLTDGTGWLTGSGGPFNVVLDPGTSSEEKILVTSRSGVTLTIAARAQDGTAAVAHSGNAVVRHCLFASDAQDGNKAAVETFSKIAAKGDLLTGGGALTNVKTALGTSGQALTVDTTQPGGVKWVPNPVVHDHTTSALGGNIPETAVTNLVADLAAKVNDTGDTMTGDLLLFNATPPAALSAAPKTYVDAQISAAVATETGNRTNADALKANIASPTFTGTVTLPGNAGSALVAVPKQQLDAATALLQVKLVINGQAVVVTANSADTSGTNDLVVATLGAITGDGATQVQMMVQVYNATVTVSTDTFFLQIWDGATAGSGTKLASALIVPNGSSNTGGLHLMCADTPSSGSHTYTARIQRNSGTGTMKTIAAGSGFPLTFTLRQVV